MLKKISFYILLPIFFSCSMTQVIPKGYLSFKNRNLSSEKVFVLPIREQIHVDDEYLQVIYDFTGAKLAKKEHQNESYYFVHIKGFGKMGQEGAPALPMRNDLLKVPMNSKILLELVESDYIEYDNFTIYPASSPISDAYGAKVPPFYKDANVYKKNQFFPENLVEVISNQVAREQRMIRVQVRPVQLNPVTKKLRVYSKLIYRVRFR